MPKDDKPLTQAQMRAHISAWLQQREEERARLMAAEEE